MGLAIAKIFGAHGFKAALISRNSGKLEPLVQELATARVEVAAFSGNVLERGSVIAALAAVKARLGAIDVLEFSPADGSLPMARPSEVTHDNAQAQIDFHVHGAITAVDAVLPDMLDKGSGTILFTTGGSSVVPRPLVGNMGVGNVGPAMAWLRNWAHALHIELAPRGVQVGHIAINTWIGQPGAAPEDIAPLYWELHTQRDQIERFFDPAVPGT
jgi:NAD(P)-dependent dehydrogenase (short-subunit alcohol dehydrogenase family)